MKFRNGYVISIANPTCETCYTMELGLCFTNGQRQYRQLHIYEIKRNECKYQSARPIRTRAPFQYRVRRLITRFRNWPKPSIFDKGLPYVEGNHISRVSPNAFYTWRILQKEFLPGIEIGMYMCMCMRMRMRLCMCICICIYICIFAYLYIYICTCICICIMLYISVCACACASACACACACACAWACAYAYAYAYVYVYVYVYIACQRYRFTNFEVHIFFQIRQPLLRPYIVAGNGPFILTRNLN